MRCISSYCLPAFLVIFLSSALQGQLSFQDFRDQPVKVVNMEQFNDPYAFNIKYREAPHPSGKAAMRAYLRKQKLAAQHMTPLNPNAVVQTRGSIPAPEILASFSGNNIITGTPLDNHLAVNAKEEVVSTINTHMLVANTVGFWLGSYKLEPFFANVGQSTHFFDPRIIYDPQQDRFILVLINGSECAQSRIVLAFSQTNNPRGNWNFYFIDGCLNDDGTFADYPMISLTETDLFLTYNAVHADSTWQTGFYGTQIHQIDKMSGFNNDTLSRRVWRDIEYNGRLLRNIVPVRNADENLPVNQFFMSDRNFDLTNDTVFLLHLTGTVSDPNPSLDITYRLLNQPYGVPPYAVQTRDSLDTNDARILDAFLSNGHIQWVSNTMDFNSGRSAVFHGQLEIDDPFQTATGHIIAHPTDYLGYPGLAWTGSEANERDAIIVMSHASGIRHPGGSAIYSDGLGAYSEIVTVIEGTRAVDMIGGTIERWGDYVGIQRLYHQPGSVWVSMSYGRQGNVNEAWIAKLARAEESTPTKDERTNIHLKTYPNPSEDYVQLEIDNPIGKYFHVELFDMNGHPLEVLYDGPASHPGKVMMSFSLHALPAGQYVVKVLVDDEVVVAHTIVRL